MALINGQAASRLSFLDRGLQYGDGLFETLPVWYGEALCVHRHLQRLARGCQVLGIPMPDTETLQREISTLATGVERGVLKLIVTRGTAGRGYAPPHHVSPTRILSLHPWAAYPPSYWSHGVVAHQCRVRLSRNQLLAGVKHLNRIEQVLARRECQTYSCPEGLMLDTSGWVIEGTMSNLFLVTDGQLITPCLGHCGVEGVMRAIIMEVIRSERKVPLRVKAIRLPSLVAAEELFFCNSLFGIWPVQRFARRTYAVGPITQHLQRELVRRRVVAHG
nr:aminodeoxychorismate lyase [Gammaproteobacteria bacterium]